MLASPQAAEGRRRAAGVVTDDRQSVPFAQLVIEQHGQLVGKRTQALATVYACQLVSQPGYNLNLDCRQHRRVSRRPPTVGEPSPQTLGKLVAIKRVTSPIPNGRRWTWRDHVGGRACA